MYIRKYNSIIFPSYIGKMEITFSNVGLAFEFGS